MKLTSLFIVFAFLAMTFAVEVPEAAFGDPEADEDMPIMDRSFSCPNDCVYRDIAYHQCEHYLHICKVEKCYTYDHGEYYKCAPKPSPSPSPRPRCPSICRKGHYSRRAAIQECSYLPYCKVDKCEGKYRRGHYRPGWWCIPRRHHH